MPNDDGRTRKRSHPGLARLVRALSEFDDAAYWYDCFLGSYWQHLATYGYRSANRRAHRGAANLERRRAVGLHTAVDKTDEAEL